MPQAYCDKRNSGLNKALLLSGLVLLVSGCVSQQSPLQLDSTSPQAVSTPSGAGLAPSTGNPQTLLSASNTIPTRAPRPGVAIAQTALPQSQSASAQTVANVTNQVNGNIQPAVSSPIAQAASSPSPSTSALAIADTNGATNATGNVIASATGQTQQIAQLQNNIPVKKPVIVSPPTVAATPKAAQAESVKVASISPTAKGTPDLNATNLQKVKKQNFFERLFAPKTTKNVSQQTKKALTKTPRPGRNIESASLGNQTPGFAKPTRAKKPATKIIKTDDSLTKPSGGGLPGVKTNNEIFGIKNHKPKTQTKTTQVASVGSFGKLSPNGLRLQHSNVQVACLKQGVLRILKQVERHYGKKPIITSGYRSPKRNRRAGGARNSQHIFCKAVDIQIEGVSKWKLAKYIRTIPGRGGVGTYCRTKSVHIDIGSVRNWHHPCRKSSKRKRKKKT